MVLDGRGTSANFWTAASPKSSRQMSLAGGKIKSLPIVKGFPHSSVGKESACNEDDPGSILGLGRSPGEGIGYPLQYSWASLMAQLVKNLPKKKKGSAWNVGDQASIPELGRSSGEGKGYPLQYPDQYSYLENSMDSPWGRKESGTTFTFTFLTLAIQLAIENNALIAYLMKWWPSTITSALPANIIFFWKTPKLVY